MSVEVNERDLKKDGKKDNKPKIQDNKKSEIDIWEIPTFLRKKK